MDSWFPGTGRKEEGGGTANGYRIHLGENENVLELRYLHNLVHMLKATEFYGT